MNIGTAMSEILYQKVREDLKQKIIQGLYPDNTQIPNEIQLQKYYQVSRVTLRNAINGLVAEGLIEKIQGKGSFVRKPSKVNRLLCQSRVESFSQVVRFNGFVPSYEVISINKGLPPQRYWDDYGKSPMLRVQRLGKVDGEAIMFERNFYPLPRFSDLAELDLSKSLYRLLQSRFGIKKLQAKDTILSMTPSNQQAAKLLNKSLGFPLFKLEMKVKDENNELVHLGEQYILADRYQFRF